MNLTNFIANNYAARKVLAPALKVRAAYLGWTFRRKTSLLDNMTRMLVSDPILRVEEFNGFFSIDRRSDLFKRIVITGQYERELAQLTLKWIAPRRDVIDIGANIGFFSVLAAKALGSARVLAIEPTPTAYLRLTENISHNSISEKVISFQGAASDIAGMVDIKYIEGREEYSSLGVMAHPAIQSESYSTVTVPAKRIDDLVKEYNLTPGLIKIDVEGMEHVVLTGAHETLERHRPVIISELSDSLLRKNGSSAREIIQMLSALGYTITDPMRPGAKPGSRPFADILCIPTERISVTQ